MARVHFVKAARKANKDAGINVGDSYYWWAFRFGGKRYSKTPPKRSQLTQSDFYGRIWDIEDDVIAKAAADESLASTRDDVCSELEDIKSECEEKLSNMPDSLQSAPTGELLQERIDALDSAISEFESLELDEPDEDDIELDDIQRELNESDEDFEKRKTAAHAEAVQAYWNDKLEEFQNISIDAP